MNLIIKLMLCVFCLNLYSPIGKTENFHPSRIENIKQPVENVRCPAERIKAKKVKKNKKQRATYRFKKKNKKRNHFKNNALQYQQKKYVNPDYIALVLMLGGIAAFIVGAILVNPIIWIIGGIAFLLGFLCFLIVTLIEPHWTRAVVLWLVISIPSAIIGVLLFILGLVFKMLALWVGGLVFILPLIIWALVFLFRFS